MGRLPSDRTFWTIQPLSVLGQIREDEIAFADPGRLPYGGFIPESYRWLNGQLRKRIPGYSALLPWWLYCEKPDLRYFRHTRPFGVREVRIELVLPAGSFVTFSVRRWTRYFSDPNPQDSWSQLFDTKPIAASDEEVGVTGRLLLEHITQVDHFVGTNKLVLSTLEKVQNSPAAR